jgi:hypothetical protein
MIFFLRTYRSSARHSIKHQKQNILCNKNARALRQTPQVVDGARAPAAPHKHQQKEQDYPRTNPRLQAPQVVHSSRMPRETSKTGLARASNTRPFLSNQSEWMTSNTNELKTLRLLCRAARSASGHQSRSDDAGVGMVGCQPRCWNAAAQTTTAKGHS